ncbi:MAG: hypothetical protein CMM47_07670 [Rhodospirillaceae bacterium]|nr:hypothetical protein [Rhodospirillaceae bacterium]
MSVLRLIGFKLILDNLIFFSPLIIILYHPTIFSAFRNFATPVGLDLLEQRRRSTPGQRVSYGLLAYLLSNSSGPQMTPKPGTRFQYNIDVVGSCNLRCPSCPVGNMGAAVMPKGLMSKATLAKVLDKIDRERPAERIMVGLYDWGEPTLHPQLAEMIKMVKDAGFESQISSNLNVDNQLRDLVKSEPNSFIVSTSGMYDATYDATHTGGSAKMLKSNLYKLAWYRDRYDTNTDFVIYYHLYKHNRGRDLLAAREIAKELGFRLETFAAYLYPMEKNLAAIDGILPQHDQALVDLLLLTPEQRIRLLRKAAANTPDHPMVRDCSHRTGKMSIRFDTSVPLCCTVYDQSTDVAQSFLDTPHEDIQTAKYNRSICAQCMGNALHIVARIHGDNPD